MRGLNETLTQTEIATAGVSNAVAQAAQLAAAEDASGMPSELLDAWNWITDPDGSGANYFPTQEQWSAISGVPVPKAPMSTTTKYLLASGAGLALFLFLKD